MNEGSPVDSHLSSMPRCASISARTSLGTASKGLAGSSSDVLASAVASDITMDCWLCRRCKRMIPDAVDLLMYGSADSAIMGCGGRWHSAGQIK